MHDSVLAGLGWGKVNFLHRGRCGALFCISAEHRVTDTEIFLVIAEQDFKKSRYFLVFFVVPCW